MQRFAGRLLGRTAAGATVGSANPHASSCGFSRGVAASTSMRLASSGTKKDYYELLGISKTASDAELKKAYRKRAMETHPDKGGDKEEFAAVSQAYEVLSDQGKRRMYDQYGHDAAANMGGPGGMGGMGGKSAEDIFSDFFRQAGFGSGGGGQQAPAAVEDTDVKLTLTLEDLYNGTTKDVRIRRPSVCGECRGEGTKKPNQKVQCTKCSGSGRVMQRVQVGPGMVQTIVQPCVVCEGAGTTIKAEDRCAKCRGDGFVTSNETVSIAVPAGVPDGAVLVMQGAGGEKPNCQPGNLNIHLEVTPHRTFKRRGDDLVLEKTISLVEALTGLELRVTLPDGKSIVVKSEEGKPLKHNGVLAVMHQGLPKHQRGGRGHLYVITKVVMPSKLTADQQEAIEKVFGKAHREDAATNKVTATTLKESYEELQQAKSSEWSGRAHAGGSSGNRGRNAPAGADCQQM